MKFNLLETGYVTVSGTPYICLTDMQYILAGNGSTVISGTSDHDLFIDCDIVDRINVYQIRYYFNSTTDSGTVASGIHFYYKNDSIDSYSSLTTQLGSGFYYAEVPGLSAPRYIRVNHTVSGTAITGTIVGLEVLNNDDIVDFGTTGELESTTAITTLDYLDYNDYIKEIPVFNDGSSPATAYIFLELQGTDVDSLISISDSEVGPWVCARSEDYVVVNGNNWLSGKYCNTYTTAYSNTWNPNDKSVFITLSDANYKATITHSAYHGVRSTQGISDTMLFSKKWYWEIYIGKVSGATYTHVGAAKKTVDLDQALGESSNAYIYRADGNKGNNGSYSAFGDTFTNGDTIGVALDIDEGKIWFSKNNTWQGSGVPVSGTNPAFSGLADEFYPAISMYYSGDHVTANFPSLTYDPPEGFLTFETLVADGRLRLYSNALTGTYTTPIFNNDSVKFAQIDMAETSVSGSIIAVDSNDYVSTLEIRSSNTKPIDYNVYRELKFTKTGTFTAAFYYKDRFVETDVEAFSSYEGTGGYIISVNLGSSQYQDNYIAGYVNNTDGKCVILHSWTYSSYGDMYLFLLSHDGYLSSNIKLRDTSMGEVFVYYLDMGVDDDFWIYMYSESALASIGYSNGGYYLFHFDSSMNRLYEERLDSNFITSCDVIKDGTNSLWCNRATGTRGIYKLTSSGTISTTYENVTEPGRLCTANDYGCWFIDSNVLYKLNSNGELETSIEDLEINNELTWVMRDESDDDFLWIVDGAYIKLIHIDGRVYRTLDFSNHTINKLYSTKDHLIVYCVDGSTGNFYTKLVGRNSGTIVKNIQNETSPTGYALEKIIKTIDYDHHILGSVIPLDHDSVWNDDLSWNKVVTSNTILPREEYHQLRLTLRRVNSSIDSPTVDAIYYQDNVKLIDIQPGQSKTLYLKVSLPAGTSSIGGDYSSMLRVWWEVPVT